MVIEGALRAIQEDRRITALFIVGDKTEIHAALPEGGVPGSSDTGGPCERSSHHGGQACGGGSQEEGLFHVSRAIELVHEDKADAVVSLGNTGGIFAAATFRLGRIPGVDRGGIATIIPTPDHQFVLLDAGANIESKPLHLAHYAVMGSVYSR